ncbi:MAG TPA: hypothetical protein VEZ47_06630 [Gemmatirosa sp.]|nr:hypothetical protein [Gemmatirosa sp.]
MSGPFSRLPRVRASAVTPVSLLLGVAPAVAGAQAMPFVAPSWLEAAVGTEGEGYVRMLAMDTARGTAYPVGVRGGWSPAELSRVVRGAGAHPWAARFALPSVGWQPRVAVLRPTAGVAANSSFPFGFNDGAVWAGRGVTSHATVGAVLTAGPLTLRLEPVAFRAENSGFRPFDNTAPGEARFRYPLEPGVDQPVRFGGGPYQRLDWGRSEARVDVSYVTAGLSAAPQAWGPAVQHPLILSGFAPGFAHAFIGTSRPLPLGIGRLHLRVVAGRLDPSDYATTPDSLAVRLMSGVTATFQPAGVLRGLEIGGTRFYHQPWKDRGTVLDAWRLPFEGFLLKEGNFSVDDPSSPDYQITNELGSVFARWAFPRSGFEMYGEYARNDASADIRDFLAQPDHSSAYTIGAARLFRRDARRWLVVRSEVVNARTTHINRLREQGRFYQHATLTQGHTQRGQVLGSPAVMGGTGYSVLVDRYEESGRTGVQFHRIVRLWPGGEGAQRARLHDVQYALLWDRTRFRRGVDLVTGAGLVYEFNRDFRRDAVNLTASVGVRWGRARR